MKIALPTQGKNIDGHFGHCECFTVYTVDDNKKIISEEIVPSPAGCGCKSDIAGTLANMGVTMLLAGNMGGGAVNVLNAQGIDVLRGCSGDVRAAAELWLQGKLSDSGVTCSHHEHGHDCHHD